MNKKRIAVLYGGDSSEREISLRTGKAVAAALSSRGHDVRPIDVRGQSLKELDSFPCDLAFIALHGAFGEDGGVQELLELRSIPYTGSGVDSSRLAMDKAAAKARFIERGIPTPKSKTVLRGSSEETLRADIEAVAFPLILKPAKEGSSVGISVPKNMDEALAGLAECFKFDEQALVEQFIEGRELTVGVLGGHALPIIELLYPGKIFDLNAKYTPGITKHIIDPDLGMLDEKVRGLGVAAHQALGCRGVSRVDIMLSLDRKPFVLEVNTIPGMTETSLVPDAARAAGISFPELCEKIAVLALEESCCEKKTA